MARAAVASWRVPARVVIDPDEKDAAFRMARAAIAKSGTSTLELAFAGIPMVAAYKVPLLEELLARLLIEVPSIILANLVLGENVVPELLQRAALVDVDQQQRLRAYQQRLALLTHDARRRDGSLPEREAVTADLGEFQSRNS